MSLGGVSMKVIGSLILIFTEDEQTDNRVQGG